MKHKAWYFRVLGIIELIGFIAVLIWWLIDTISNAYITRGWSIWLSIIALAVILFFGPSLALLLFGHADILKKVFPEDNYKKDIETKISEKIEKSKHRFKLDINDEVKMRYSLIDPSTNIEVKKGTKGKIIDVSGPNCSAEFFVNERRLVINTNKEYFKKIK